MGGVFKITRLPKLLLLALHSPQIATSLLHESPRKVSVSKPDPEIYDALNLRT